MRLFVYEYACAGASGPEAASLRTEGWAMLSALLHDFARLPGVAVDTLLSAEVLASKRGAPAGVVIHPAADGHEEASFRRLAAAADWTLVVAPECGDVLPERLRWVADAGGRALGPTPGAARLAGDKLRLAEHLRAAGVPTPCTAAWPARPPSYPAVCKPRHGAGSQATYLVRDDDELRQVAARARAEGCADEMIVQPFVCGEAASVAFLVGPGRRLALPPMAQRLSDDGRFHYLGGGPPLAGEPAARAAALAARAAAAVDGLGGYVGVDLILGATTEGDAVIEINPRMTTSYVGLRALARFNLAGAMLAVAEGKEPPSWEWGEEPVRFTADGLTSG